MRNGHDHTPAGANPGIPVAKTTTYTTFAYFVNTRPDGVKELILTSLDGHQQVFPFTPTNADDVARQMASPAIQTA